MSDLWSFAAGRLQGLFRSCAQIARQTVYRADEVGDRIEQLRPWPTRDFDFGGPLAYDMGFRRLASAGHRGDDLQRLAF
jgi:hypothetical protein